MLPPTEPEGYSLLQVRWGNVNPLKWEEANSCALGLQTLLFNFLIKAGASYICRRYTVSYLQFLLSSSIIISLVCVSLLFSSDATKVSMIFPGWGAPHEFLHRYVYVAYASKFCRRYHKVLIQISHTNVNISEILTLLWKILQRSEEIQQGVPLACLVDHFLHWPHPVDRTLWCRGCHLLWFWSADSSPESWSQWCPKMLLPFCKAKA